MVTVASERLNSTAAELQLAIDGLLLYVSPGALAAVLGTLYGVRRYRRRTRAAQREELRNGQGNDTDDAIRS